MRIWLSYSILCHTLKAHYFEGKSVELPAPGDRFFFGCRRSIVGLDPYGGHTGNPFPEPVLQLARDLYSEAVENGHAFCAGDNRASEALRWETLARLTDDPERFLALLGDHKDEGFYNYPRAGDILEEMGIRGIRHVPFK